MQCNNLLAQCGAAGELYVCRFINFSQQVKNVTLWKVNCRVAFTCQLIYDKDKENCNRINVTVKLCSKCLKSLFLFCSNLFSVFLDFKRSSCSECSYSFFRVIAPRLNFTCRHFHLHMWCKREEFFMLTPHMNWQCSETSTHKIQTTGNYPKETIQHIFS